MSDGSTHSQTGTPEVSAQTALSVLRELTADERPVMYDAGLNAALAPLREHPAIETVCGKPACEGRRLAWCALAPGAAYVAATQDRAVPRARRGGLSDLAEPRPRTMDGFMGWIELAMTGKTTVTLVDVSTPGWPTRLRLSCRTCHTGYVLTSSTLLTHFLESIAAGTGRITVSY